MTTRTQHLSAKLSTSSSQLPEQTRKRIKAPDFDNSALIMENTLTIVGRVTNPREQPIGELLIALPKKWTLQSGVTGSDLGLNTFQFRFESEEDLKGVLDNRPFHYARWMVILQRWEPVLSPTFPSQIPFWIRLHGLPLHYWHEKMIYNIGQDLGHLDTYYISKTSARIRVLVDGLKPLIKEAIIDFKSGEEVPIQLEYEGLEQHCSNCNILCHLASHCSLLISRNYVRDPDSPRRTAYSRVSPSRAAPRLERTQSFYKKPEEQTQHFSQRLDRYGRPFGERLHLPPYRAQGPRNKIIPHHEGTSYVRKSPPPLNSHGQRNTSLQTSDQPQRSPNLQWRVRQQNTTSLNEEAFTPVAAPTTTRPPLERNLEVTDFPPPSRVPSNEEVMEELREVTLQYTNVDDPVERAARMQRVLHGEENDLMARTAAGIIATASINLQNRSIEQSSQQNSQQLPLHSSPPHCFGSEAPESSRARASGNGQGTSRRSTASPRTLPGASSRKRRLAQIHSHGFPHASPIQTTQARTRKTPARRPARSNAPLPPHASSTPTRNQQGFQSDQARLP